MENIYINLLEYINKNTCIECGYNLLKCYGYCMKHINKLDIVTLHKELLTIFEKLTDIEKINLKLSIAEIMFKIKHDKRVLKRKIYEYKDKYLKQPKTAEIIANNKEFINKNNVLYKKIIEKYTLTDKEKRKRYKQISKVDFRLMYEIDDKYLLELSQNIINIFKLKQLIYEETRLLSFFNNTEEIRDIHIDTSDYLVMEILKHNFINRRISYLERERPIKINDVTYRSDIYIMIETNNNNLMPIIIETDERHHNNNEDIIKKSFNIICKYKRFI
mgnify:FL=1